MLIIDGDLVNVVAQTEFADIRSLKRVGIETFNLRHVLARSSQIDKRIERRDSHSQRAALVEVVDALNEHVVKFPVNGHVAFVTGRRGVGDVVCDNVRASLFAYHTRCRRKKSAPHFLPLPIKNFAQKYFIARQSRGVLISHYP